MSAAQGTDRQNTAQGDFAIQQKGDSTDRRAEGSVSATRMLTGGANPMEARMPQTLYSRQPARQMGWSCFASISTTVYSEIQDSTRVPRAAPQAGHSLHTLLSSQAAQKHTKVQGWERDVPAALPQLWPGLHTLQHRFPATPHPAVLQGQILLLKAIFLPAHFQPMSSSDCQMLVGSLAVELGPPMGTHESRSLL